MKKIISIIIVTVLLITMIPLSTFTASAVSVYNVGNWAEFYNALIAENDATIELTADIDFESSFSYSTVNIKGNKILNLNSYSIVYNYKNNQVDPYMNYSNRSVMFNIPSDASLTINDDVGNKGRIFFDAYMLDPYDFVMCAIRDIFTVSGKLTINGGEIEAGRSKEQYVTALVNNGSLYTGYLWQQIYGTAVTLYDNGELIVNGGNVYGRGGPILYDHDTGLYYSGSAVKLQDNSKVTINGGNFRGFGGASVFSVNDFGKLRVNAGTFDTSKLDAMLYNRNGIAVCRTSKGCLGIPNNAWINNMDYLRITADGTVYDFGKDKSNLDLLGMDKETIIENIGLGFKWLSPDVNVTEKVTDLGRVYLGTSQMNMTFAFEANPLAQKYIDEGYSVYGVAVILEGYNGIYYDQNGGDIRFNEVIKNEGNYKVYQTLELYKNGRYITEYSHYFTVNVVEPVYVYTLNAKVEEPDVGNYPTNATTTLRTSKVSYTEWYEVIGSGEYDLKLMSSTDKFEVGKTYECCVTFVPNNGYAFTDNITGTINGDYYSYGYRSWYEATINRRFTVEKTKEYGDVNLDGEISVDDVTHLQMALARFFELNAEQTVISDVNFDGTISVDDVTRIQLYLAKSITSFE